MKKIFIAITAIVTTFASKAQITEQLDFGVMICPGATYANIKDENSTPSKQDKAADGFTTIEENGLKASNFKLMVNYNFSETWALSSGFYFNHRRLNVRNEDGSYVGTSNYHVNYLSIPVMARYTSEEVANNLRILAYGGILFDLKTKEEAVGADYAHYMNFANDREDIDNQRGANGNNKVMPLFGGAKLSANLSAYADYAIKDQLHVMAGFSYQYGISNILNSDLKYNDQKKTSVAEYQKWRASLFTFDFGVGFNFN
jgi:hypothetical protein